MEASVSPIVYSQTLTPWRSYSWEATGPNLPQLALAQDPRDRLGCRSPSCSLLPVSVTQQVHHAYPALPTPLLRPSWRPPHRECGSLSSRFIITPRARSWRTRQMMSAHWPQKPHLPLIFLSHFPCRLWGLLPPKPPSKLLALSYCWIA